MSQGLLFPVLAVRQQLPRHLPNSPDDRAHGQAGTLEAPAVAPGKLAYRQVIDVATLDGCTVSFVPTDNGAGSSPRAGTARVRMSPPGGGGWERDDIEIPRWGACVNCPAGRGVVEVDAAVGSGRWSVAIAPGWPRSTWVPAGIIQLPAAGTVTVRPPRFATSLRVAVLEGSAAFGFAGSVAVAAPGTLTIPAFDVLVTAGGAGCTVLHDWEVFA